MMVSPARISRGMLASVMLQDTAGERVTGAPRSVGSPCDGCPRRSVCRAPCEAVEALLPAPGRGCGREVLSRVLSGSVDAARSPAFRVEPPELVEPPEASPGPAGDGPELHTLRRGLAALTPVQRAALLGNVEGRTFTAIGAELRCSKQAAHRVVHRGMRNLRRLCGMEQRPWP